MRGRYRCKITQHIPVRSGQVLAWSLCYLTWLFRKLIGFSFLSGSLTSLNNWVEACMFNVWIGKPSVHSGLK